MPFEGMSINTGPAGGGESMEGSAEGQLQWGKKSPRCKRKRSGGSADPLSELTDDDGDLLVHPRAQHASMHPAADSLAFAQPQTNAHQEQQQQQQHNCERSQSYSEDLGASAEEEGAEDEAVDEAGWQSTSKTCFLCDNGGQALLAAATVAMQVSPLHLCEL